jgi:hypothetical protein
MQVRRTSKQPRDGEKGGTKQLSEEEINKAKQLKEEEKRRAKRLKEENEITTTILSGVKNFPKEKIIYE